MGASPSSLYVTALCMCLCKVMKTLTKLYPGADCSYRNVVDLLQVVLYVTLGHSVQTCPRGDEEKRKTDEKGRENERKESRGYVRRPASVLTLGNV